MLKDAHDVVGKVLRAARLDVDECVFTGMVEVAEFVSVREGEAAFVTEQRKGADLCPTIAICQLATRLEELDCDVRNRGTHVKTSHFEISLELPKIGTE